MAEICMPSSCGPPDTRHIKHTILDYSQEVRNVFPSLPATEPTHETAKKNLNTDGFYKKL